MDVAMVGLGKMGASMATRLLRGGHRVVAFDVRESATKAIEAEGVEGARNLEKLVGKLKPPRTVWVMVPAGEPTESVLGELADRLSPGDVVIEGGNSNYKDTVRRAARLKERGLHFLDVGTSGGVWGSTEGYGMMVGGEERVVERMRPIFETLAPAPGKGWGWVGPSGSGHFVKMIHNGIEYGMMEAYAEGFEVLKAKTEFELDLRNVAEIWRYGSVVRSWLLDLIAAALEGGPELDGIKDWVADSGEGRWTVAEAIDLDVPAPVITLSLLMRLASRQERSYAAKLLAAMRKQFGGHEVKRDD